SGGRSVRAASGPPLKGSQDLYTRRRGDDDNRGAPDEQPAFHRPDGLRNPPLDGAWIGERPEPAIEDVVAAIGDVRLFPAGVAPLRGAAQPGEGDGRDLPAELGDLDRNRGVFAEALDQLLLIDHYDQPVARCGDDLFAQQRATQALDQIERA